MEKPLQPVCPVNFRRFIQPLLNGLKPYNYLTYVMEKMKDLGAFPAKEEMLELLPWSSNLPDDCRSKLKK